MKETIRQFKSIILPTRANETTIRPAITDPKIKLIQERQTQIITKQTNMKTIQKGYIISPELIKGLTRTELLTAKSIIEQEITINPTQANQAFHKNWDKIRNAPTIQLIIEQITHYLTTYGYKQLGTYQDQTIYIPPERLQIPELEEGITLTIIQARTAEEIKQKTLELLETGIALKPETIQDLAIILIKTRATQKEISKTRNKEARILLHKYMGTTPKDPKELIRYIIYETTGKTLIIKNKQTLETIKNRDNIDIINILTKYMNQHGLEPIAQNFHRYKPILLALKTNTILNNKINKIRRLAKKHHKPMKQDYLNTITEKIKKGTGINIRKLEKALENANTYRKIRLAYALNYRLGLPEHTIYRIRNGKTYMGTIEDIDMKATQQVLEIIKQSIAKDLKPKLENKKIHIPEWIEYALPTTEKQYIENIPAGTKIITKNDTIVGVHWENKPRKMIDIDLSLINATGKIGWDAQYRTERRNILFSGDMTSAPKPNGATELFWIEKPTPKHMKALITPTPNSKYMNIQMIEEIEQVQLINLNYYNKEGDKEPLPYKIIIAEETPTDYEQNYMINPNNILLTIPTRLENTQQKVIGTIVVKKDKTEIIIMETNMTGGRTARNNKYTNITREYIKDYYLNTINLKEILKKAGAKIVETPEEADIDLTPTKLEKDTIIKLINK